MTTVGQPHGHVGNNSTSVPAKSIFVYRNGDTNFQCKRIVINPRQIKNWDSFIELMTSRVKAKNGAAVRRVFTPKGRTKITDLGSIENNHFYVAAGMESFQRKEYNKITDVNATRRTTLGRLPPIIRPVQHSRLKVSARCRRAAGAVGSKVIYVFRNGDANSAPVKILFTKFMLKNYDVVLNEVTRKVNIMTGAVWRLHSMDGQQLTGSDELEENQFYVACGREAFKKIPYPKDGVVFSPRAPKQAPVRQRPVKKPIKIRKEVEPPPPQPQKPKPSKKPTPPKKKKPVKTKEQKEAEEVFHSKPAIVKRSREKDHKDLDYGDDPEGVFKAKEERYETKGASEVQETQETAVDLPIDQVAAEEIDDEDDIPDQNAGLDDDIVDHRRKSPEPEPEREPSAEPHPVPDLEPVNLFEEAARDETPRDEDSEAPPPPEEVPEEVQEEEAPPVGGVDEDGAGDDYLAAEAGGEEEDPEPQPPKEPEEDQSSEPSGYYSKRTPVTSKRSPTLASVTAKGEDQTGNKPGAVGSSTSTRSKSAPDPSSPAHSITRMESPNLNNSNSAVSRAVPSQSGGDDSRGAVGSAKSSVRDGESRGEPGGVPNGETQPTADGGEADTMRDESPEPSQNATDPSDIQPQSDMPPQSQPQPETATPQPEATTQKDQENPINAETHEGEIAA